MNLLEQAIYNCQSSLINLVLTKKKMLTTDKKYTDNKLDILSFIILAEKALTG